PPRGEDPLVAPAHRAVGDVGRRAAVPHEPHPLHRRAAPRGSAALARRRPNVALPRSRCRGPSRSFVAGERGAPPDPAGCERNGRGVAGPGWARRCRRPSGAAMPRVVRRIAQIELPYWKVSVTLSTMESDPSDLDRAVAAAARMQAEM